MGKSKLAALSVAVLLAVGLGYAHAKLISMPRDEPLKDVLARVEAWVKAHPQDGAGYYTLGRVQALGWAYGEKVPVIMWAGDQLPAFGEYNTIRITREGPNAVGSFDMDGKKKADADRGAATAADLEHLQASIDAYTMAVKLDPANGLYEEGLAWMLQRKGEAGVAMADPAITLAAAERARIEHAVGQLAANGFEEREAGSKQLLEAMPGCAGMLKAVQSDDTEVVARIAAVFRDYWNLQALPHDRRAYALALPADLKIENPAGVDSLVSADAAGDLLTILAAQPAAAKPGEVEGLKESAEKLAEKRKDANLIIAW